MAFLNKKGDKYKGIAFWLDQTITYPTNVKLANYAISIDQLEELTGIDFFVNLNDNLEKLSNNNYNWTHGLHYNSISFKTSSNTL